MQIASIPQDERKLSKSLRVSSLPLRISKRLTPFKANPIEKVGSPYIFPNLGYSSKYIEQIYRAQYGAAMLMYVRFVWNFGYLTADYFLYWTNKHLHKHFSLRIFDYLMYQRLSKHLWLELSSWFSEDSNPSAIAGEPPQISEQCSWKILMTLPWQLLLPLSTACLYLLQMAFSCDVKTDFVNSSFLCGKSVPLAVASCGEG